jgi:hypothetical protein
MNIFGTVLGICCRLESLWNFGVVSDEIYVRFQVLTAGSTKLTAFWDVALCSLFAVDQRFRGV